MVKIKIGLRFLGNRDRLAVKITKTPQVQVAGVADYDVVENFDFEKLTGSNEITGDFDVPAPLGSGASATECRRAQRCCAEQPRGAGADGMNTTEYFIGG